MIRDVPGRKPRIHPDTWIDPSAEVIGDVTIEQGASVWPGAVLRGDEDNYVRLGRNSNVQDGSVLHVTPEYPCIVGDGVTIGHRAVVHACTIKDNARIGIGAVVLTGAGPAAAPQPIGGRQHRMRILRRLTRHRDGSLDQSGERVGGQIGQPVVVAALPDEDSEADLLALRTHNIFQLAQAHLHRGRGVADIKRVGGVGAGLARGVAQRGQRLGQAHRLDHMGGGCVQVLVAQQPGHAGHPLAA